MKLFIALVLALFVDATALAQQRSWQELELEFQDRQRQREGEWEERHARQRAPGEAQSALKRQCADARARLGALQPVYITADSSYRAMDTSDVERLGAFVDQDCGAE